MVAIQGLPVVRPTIPEWSADSASEISSVDTQPVQVHSQRRYPRSRRGSTLAFDDSDRGRQGRRGRRGNLRYYNEHLLHQLKEAHEVELEDEDYLPGYSNRESALSTLMSDDHCMEEWYNTSMHECYEDELTSSALDDGNRSDIINDSSEDDSRKVHPAAVSPDVAYCRISWRLRRGLLRRRHLPMEEMNDVEGELRQHFSERPRVCSKILPPLSRLITHAVAEYLGLQSHSEDLTSELLKKRIVVSNGSTTFAPPHVQLSAYLNRRHR